MDNLFQNIESEEVVVYTNQVYSIDFLKKSREMHKKLIDEGKIEGNFDADKWMGYSGVNKVGIDFSFNVMLYNKHIGAELGISADTMKNMLRCYVMNCYGIYIFQTIAKEKIQIVKDFLVKYGDKDFRLTETGIITVEDFLLFIGTTDKQINHIASNIRLKKNIARTQRKLSPIINYLVIENEINHIYRDGCDDAEFKKWFPIYFWVNITFILPLRATEMLVTPKECIYRENDKIFLRIRRTNLKKGKRTVYYDVNKDYKVCSYEVPDTEVIGNIEKYLRLTASQDRRFLFEYGETMINDMFSLKSFNYLLAMFMKQKIIGNGKYDFARYASGITEFEIVSAGDSRPIAMANLYFQNAGEDICRQLADHVHIDTSSGYYTNISETIWASSVVQLQKNLDYERRYPEEKYEKSDIMVTNTKRSVCTSQKRMMDNNNLEDCIAQGHLAECMGCKFYRPTKGDLEAFIRSQQVKADDSAKKVIEFMNNTMSIKNRDVNLEEVFLLAQTNATRYRMGCNIKAEEKLKEWQRLKNIQKTSY